MANEPLSPVEENPWWWVRLGRAMIRLLPGTAQDNLEEANEDESFSEQQTAEEPVKTCSSGPAQPETTPARKKKKRRKKKKIATATTEQQPDEEVEVEEEEDESTTTTVPAPVEKQPVEESEDGWVSTSKPKKKRETRWYDKLPHTSDSGKSDACESIASGRGEHTADHLPDLIVAVGEGDFGRDILARIIAEAFKRNEIVATNTGISRHYLLTEIPHALEPGGRKRLVSPIIVVHNTIVDPLRKSYGTCYPITWTKANAYRRGNTAH